jgi:hypothetical protein
VNSYFVKSVADTANGYKAVVSTTYTDDKGKSEGSVDLIMKCANGIFYFDMKNFLGQSMSEPTEGAQVTITAQDMQFPSTLTAGATLPDASITYQMNLNGMTMMVNITERKVMEQESLITLAGTFTVWKITSKIQSKSGFVNIKISSVEYLSLGAGVVKTESYNEKGELLSYNVLTKLNKL